MGRGWLLKAPPPFVGSWVQNKEPLFWTSCGKRSGKTRLIIASSYFRAATWRRTKQQPLPGESPAVSAAASGGKWKHDFNSKEREGPNTGVHTGEVKGQLSGTPLKMAEWRFRVCVCVCVNVPHGGRREEQTGFWVPAPGPGTFPSSHGPRTCTLRTRRNWKRTHNLPVPPHRCAAAQYYQSLSKFQLKTFISSFLFAAFPSVFTGGG